MTSFPFTAPKAAHPLDGPPELALTTLYRAAIGPINTDYYLPLFNRFEAAERVNLSWNWAAGVYTFNWMLLRHLWGAALIYSFVIVALPLLILGLGRLVFQWSEFTEIAVLIACIALSIVIPGAVGNALFHSGSRKKMAAALAATDSLDEACAWLNHRSSSRARFIRILQVNAILVCVVVVTYLLLAVRTVQMPEPVPPTRPTPIAQPAQPTAGPIKAEKAGPSSMLVNTVLTLNNAVAASPEPTAELPVPAPVAPEQKSASSESGYFFVNVGLFANAANAHKAYRKIMAAGLPALARTVKANERRLIRVRAGPFDSQAKAAEAAAQIRTLSLDAVVVPP